MQLCHLTTFDLDSPRQIGFSSGLSVALAVASNPRAAEGSISLVYIRSNLRAMSDGF